MFEITKTAYIGTTKIKIEKFSKVSARNYFLIRKLLPNGGISLDGNKKVYIDENIYLTGNVIDITSNGKVKLIEIIPQDGIPGWIWLEADRAVSLLDEWFEPINALQGNH